MVYGLIWNLSIILLIFFKASIDTCHGAVFWHTVGRAAQEEARQKAIMLMQQQQRMMMQQRQAAAGGAPGKPHACCSNRVVSSSKLCIYDFASIWATGMADPRAQHGAPPRMFSGLVFLLCWCCAGFFFPPRSEETRMYVLRQSGKNPRYEHAMSAHVVQL